jgi:hypothetical protein
MKVKPNHIQTLHGWWLPELKGPEPDLFGVCNYQINRLIPGPQASKSGFGYLHELVKEMEERPKMVLFATR